MEKSELSDVYDTAKKYVVNRIIEQGIFDLLFLCILFSSLIFFQASMVVIGILLGLWAFSYFIGDDYGRFAVFIVIALTAILFAVFSQSNLIHDLLGNIENIVSFKAMKDNINPMDSFFAYYGWLAILGILAELLTAVYIYYSNLPKQKKIEVDDTPSNLWELFLTERSFGKFLLLIIFLILAAINEEIIYRYIIMNLLAAINIDGYTLPIIAIIIISSFIFGLMHYSVGGWFHVISSTFAGIIFSISFLEGDIFSSWLLHLFWNALVMIQILTSILLRQRYNEGDK